MQRRKKAVALKYEPGAAQAPKVLAKGAGKLAEAITEAAHAHGVPIECDELLAEELMLVELNCEIPEELYRAVAEILAFVYREYRSFSMQAA